MRCRHVREGVSSSCRPGFGAWVFGYGWGYQLLALYPLVLLYFFHNLLRSVQCLLSRDLNLNLFFASSQVNGLTMVLP